VLIADGLKTQTNTGKDAGALVITHENFEEIVGVTCRMGTFYKPAGKDLNRGKIQRYGLVNFLQS
jgi:hypothetical protein